MAVSYWSYLPSESGLVSLYDRSLSELLHRCELFSDLYQIKMDIYLLTV